MRHILRVSGLLVALALSACTSTSAIAPDLRGAKVEPLNPTRWDHRDAVQQREQELARRPEDRQ